MSCNVIRIHDGMCSIKAYLDLGKQSNIPYEEILEMLVINLQSEKQAYFDSTVKLTMKAPPQPAIGGNSGISYTECGEMEQEIIT